MEPETGGQFKLGQNFPNPYVDGTSVPFTLKNPSDVTIELFDAMGKKVAIIPAKALGSGEHAIKVDPVA